MAPGSHQCQGLIVLANQLGNVSSTVAK